MAKRKTRKVVLTPHKTNQARVSGPKVRARSSSKKKSPRRARKSWHTSDVDFDSRGRLVILNPQLASRIARNVSDDGLIHMVVPGGIRDGVPRLPPPTDAMCGCRDFTLQLTKVEKINVRRNR
jgi:hypothetical protein